MSLLIQDGSKLLIQDGSDLLLQADATPGRIMSSLASSGGLAGLGGLAGPGGGLAACATFYVNQPAIYALIERATI